MGMAGSSQKRQQNQKTRKDDQLDEKHGTAAVKRMTKKRRYLPPEEN